MEELVLEMRLFFDDLLGYGFQIIENFTDGSENKRYLTNFKEYDVRKYQDNMVIELWEKDRYIAYKIVLHVDEIKNIKLKENTLQLNKEYVTIIIAGI